jgi:ferredoxin like protein
MNPISIEDKLAVNKYDIDRDVHIKFDENICKTCDKHTCLYICPAVCFKLSEGHIIFSYEGCLECGSCRIACEKKAIDWTIPRPGFGVCYEFG